MNAEQEAEALENYKAYSITRNARLAVEAQSGDQHTLDQTVLSHIPVLTFRYISTDTPLPVIEAELHTLWYTVILAAKYWQAGNPKHDTLIRAILNAKSKGLLSRHGVGSADAQEQETRRFSDGGQLWSDLPLLGHDLVDEWRERYYGRDYANDTDQRANLASFVGRLVSVGIFDATAACVLSLFRETLETPRPLESLSELAVGPLLRALFHLLLYAGGNVGALHEANINTANSNLPLEISRLGELAIQSGTVTSSGYSAERWQFWIQKLEELMRCNIEDVADNAKRCINLLKGLSASVPEEPPSQASDAME